jgi:AraC-like DNA-binding protein/quercetin dioxygenase-like cupin family protein
MRARLEQLSHRQNGQSFLCYRVSVPRAEFLWHYHPEYELTYIEKGKGKRLVGDSYENFEPGDLVLLGPLLPHTWVSEKGKNERCEAIVIQFSSAFIDTVLQFPEMAVIKKLLAASALGLHFKTVNEPSTIEAIQKMACCNGIEAFALFIKILHGLSQYKSQALATGLFKPLKGNEDEQRINKVLMYVQNNFKKSLSLAKAANLVHLSQSAFCKFFKLASGKTFSGYLNEIRIAHACQLLTETDKPISEIAFASGFESLTYFNRVFLKVKSCRPSYYRKRFA